MPDMTPEEIKTLIKNLEEERKLLIAKKRKLLRDLGYTQDAINDNEHYTNLLTLLLN